MPNSVMKTEGYDNTNYVCIGFIKEKKNSQDSIKKRVKRKKMMKKKRRKIMNLIVCL
jgi:hypothetical protein